MKEKEYLLSVTEVKNTLNTQSREVLIKLLLDSYKTIPQVKEYISVKYTDKDTIEWIFEDYKDKIYNVFFPKNMGAQFKISEAKKAINDFKNICSDEKFIIELMIYYVEMGVEFTNVYGDINESFYNSIESMYQSVVKAINKHKNSEIFNVFRDRLKAIVDGASEIGWGFHEELGSIYLGIKWLELQDVDFDKNELEQIKEYISDRVEKRNNLPTFDIKISISEAISAIIDVDELFLLKMVAQGGDYNNDDEHVFISDKTGYSIEFIELILWQRYCYEMENNRWEYAGGKCRKCGSNELYIMEVPNVDFEDQVICKQCGTEFVRE